MEGYTIERNGLVSQEMLFSSMIYDLVREGFFKVIYAQSSTGATGLTADAMTVKATLEFVGDEMGLGAQPWRMMLDGSSGVEGGQILTGTATQLPDDGSFFRFTDPTPQTESAKFADAVGRLGVTKAVISGMKPITNITTLGLRITGGLVNLNGQILYIPDSEPSLQLTDLSPNSSILVGVADDGTIVTDDDSAPLLLFTVYTNTNGVYNVSYSDAGFVASDFVAANSIGYATPYSYRLSVTTRGVACEIWQNANPQERNFSWFVIQRMVDSVTGKCVLTGHSPVTCLYSVGNSNIPYNYDIINKSIYKLIVRENDQVTPSKPTTISSNSDYVSCVINPMKQITTAESNQYYVIFPSGINTHRHLYNDELDMIAYTSAGVLSQWNDAAINAYGEATVDFINGTSLLIPGAKLTTQGIDQDGEPITVCAFVKSVSITAGTLASNDAIGTLTLHSLDGGTIVKTKDITTTNSGGDIVVCCVANSDSKNIMRKYRGGNANYNTAEGMRILFLIANGGITKDYGIIQGQHNISDAPVIGDTIFDEELGTVSLSFTMPEPDVTIPPTLVTPESYNIFYSNREDFYLSFKEGNALVKVGNVIDSGAGTAEIIGVSVSSGSLGTGDAEGIIRISPSKVSGVFNSGEVLKVKNVKAATVTSNFGVGNVLAQYYVLDSPVVKAGDTLYFAVAAVTSDAGTIVQSSLSEQSSVFITDITTPKNVIAMPEEFGLTIQWDPVA